MATRRTTSLLLARERLATWVLAIVCLLPATRCAAGGTTGGESPGLTSRQHAIEDVDFLIRQLREKHPNPFGRVSEARFLQEAEQLKEGLPERVAIREFSLSIAALLALVEDDHTRHRDLSSYYEHINRGGRLFPVKLRCQERQMVVEAWSPQVIPARVGVGDAIVAVNGEATESIVTRYGRYLSLDTDQQRRWAWEWWFDKYQVLLGDARDEYRLRLRDGQGREYEETLPAAPPWLAQYEDSKRSGPAFQYELHHGGQTCLFRIRHFSRNAQQEYEDSVRGLLDAMRRRGTGCLILDLRGNGGGDSGLGMGLLRMVIDRPYAEDLKPASDGGCPVKLALLCDRSSYSAASWLAMVVKDCKAGIIAGEETGGRASFFGDIVHVSLPHTGLSCGIATRFFMRRAGYDDRRGVLPDLALDVTQPDGKLVDEIRAFLCRTEGQGMSSW